MRAAVVVGLLALLCGPADAAPKAAAKQRPRTFARYIDPAAPRDPPRPPPRAEPAEPEANALSIVMLVERSSDAAQLEAAKQALFAVQDMLGEDLVALLAFDESVDYVQKPMWADVSPKKLRNAIKKLKASEKPANVAAALDDARDYMFEAPGRRIIVLVSNGSDVGAELDDVLRAVHDARITIIVLGLPDGNRDALAQIAEKSGGRLFMLDAGRGAREAESYFYYLHWGL